MRAAAAPLTSIVVSVGTGYGKTLLAPALACVLQSDVVAIVPLERLSVQMAGAARPVLGDAHVCVVPFGADGVPELLRGWFGQRHRPQEGRGGLIIAHPESLATPEAEAVLKEQATI